MLSLSDPSGSQTEVTPSDSTTLATYRSLYVGTGGNVTILNKTGQTVLFTNVGPGSILPVLGTKVLATGTTASNIVALH